MVRTQLTAWDAFRPAKDRVTGDAHPWRSLDGLDNPDQLCRPEIAPMLGKARGKVEHAKNAICGIEARFEHVSVLEVALRAGSPFGWANGEAASSVLIEQRREDGLSVKPGEAAPRHIAIGTNQRRILAIPDQALLFKAHSNEAMRKG